MGDWLMKVRSAISFMALGAGSVLAYQQVKNGNFDKMMKKFKKEGFFLPSSLAKL